MHLEEIITNALIMIKLKIFHLEYFHFFAAGAAPPVVCKPVNVLNESYIHHWNPVNVPIITILVPNPLHSPLNPT